MTASHLSLKNCVTLSILFSVCFVLKKVLVNCCLKIYNEYRRLIMKILNFASCNIDYVYSLAHIARAGETLHTSGFNIFPGGKGKSYKKANRV